MKQHHPNQTSVQVAEVELTYRTTIKASERPLISASSAAYEIFSRTWETNHIDSTEQFNVLLLNRANRVLGAIRLPTDSYTRAISYPKLIFSACVKANAVAIILGHYHPARNVKLKEQDTKLGKELKYFGNFLDISFLDFLIVTESDYCSLADQGLL